MARNEVEEYTCTGCNRRNRVTWRWSGFAPSDHDRETALCAKCRDPLASKACFTVDVELVRDAEALLAPDVISGGRAGEVPVRALPDG